MELFSMGTTLKFLEVLLNCLFVLLITSQLWSKYVLRMNDSLDSLCCNEPSHSQHFLLCSMVQKAAIWEFYNKYLDNMQGMY